MKEDLKKLINDVNNLPFILKLLLCIPVVEIFYGICRIINQATKEKVSVLWLVIAILTVFPGAAIMWLVDVICVVCYGHAFLLG